MPDFIALIRARLEAEGAGRLAQSDAVDEIAHHLADIYTAALRQGRSADEAADAAASELHAMTPLADAIDRRERRRVARAAPPIESGGLGLSTVPGDLRQAVRLFRARPGYTALVVSTLALGLGACTAVFSLLNAMLLSPLPYPDPDRLTLVWESDADDPSSSFIVAAPNYQDWVEQARSYEALGMWEYLTFNVSGDAEPAQIAGIRSTASLFRVLGVRAAMGRTFSVEEEAPGRRVAVVSDAVWRTHLGGQADAIGRPIRLNGTAYEVIGVMPRGVEFPRKGYGVWIPMALTDQDRERGAHSFYVAARLEPGVSFEQARAEMHQIGRALSERYEENRNEGATLTRMQDLGMANVRRVLMALSGAVGLVLLIACVNVANLQMGLGLARRREFVVRLTLGAGFGRLVQQALCESLVLAAAGGAAGVALAWTATRAVDVVLTPGFRTLPFRGDVPITIDLTVLAFAAGASLVSAILFGFSPLVGLRRREPQPLLRDGERGSTRFATGARRVLVTVELALAIIVLCAAGLLIKSLATVLSIAPGFDPADVLTMQVSLPQNDTYGPPERAGFCRDLANGVEGLPGIRSVGAISHLPLSGANASRGIAIDGRPAPAPNEAPGANYRLICPGYFQTLGIPVIAGRDFSLQDVREGALVVIINRATADRFWPSQDPIGQRIKLGGVDSRNPWMTIVGVVENVRHFELEAEARREMFRPYSQAAWPVMTIVAKTAGDPLLWQRPLKDALKRVDPHLPAAGARSMEQVVGGSVSWRETPMRLLAGFALIGLVLAGLGVYGVLAYYVSQRTREIGVRVALGASRAGLVALVLRQSLVPIAAGIVLGIAGSIGSAKLLSGLLYEVQPSDPVVLVSVAGVLAMVGLVASWLPARRAASIDPITALREE